MLRTIKPKNARSKRALEAREPKEVETAKTAIFVRGTHTGETLNAVMKDLDTSSLDFWSLKNDASLFLIGQDTKKRPDNLTFVRMFDHRVLDMCEVGVTSIVGMSDLKTPKCTPGHRPIIHFAPNYSTPTRDSSSSNPSSSTFSEGDPSDRILLSGVEHVISISLGPTPSSLSTSAPTISATTIDDPATLDSKEYLATLPSIHIRTYTIQLKKSGTRIPLAQLTPMGPHLDLILRRHTPADPALLKLALQKPKLAKSDIQSGLGKKRKNVETDEMGDVRGQIHLGKQDLSSLQVRKMRGLKEDGGRGSAKRRKSSRTEDGQDTAADPVGSKE
ncbi:hypothetical protein BS47DRAFT_1379955 [Hydnum rufescens UP504]|uniref:Ribosome production factor 2 homolog n=1 Tax=Hydnum rufescens UP504 TaxID=1448309 RepID=A0A9P6B632_9AGAM|nr:hypothetical protein BS47DRAFT_1379955 [Hydnum rufescens UP504]